MTDERTPNVPLLRKAVEWVEEQEQLTQGREWYQEAFIAVRETDRNPYCQTTFCIAGKVAMDAGWRFVPNTLDVTKDTERGPVDEVSAAMLGLNMDQAWMLFDGQNTAVDIRHIAETIAGERL